MPNRFSKMGKKSKKKTSGAKPKAKVGSGGDSEMVGVGAVSVPAARSSIRCQHTQTQD